MAARTWCRWRVVATQVLPSSSKLQRITQIQPYPGAAGGWGTFGARVASPKTLRRRGHFFRLPDPTEDLHRAAAPNQSVSGSELPVSQQEKSGKEEGYAQVHPFGDYCGGDRVLGLGAARGGPRQPHRHRHRLILRERDHRRIGQRLGGGGFRRDPSSPYCCMLGHEPQEDQILRPGPLVVGAMPVRRRADPCSRHTYTGKPQRARLRILSVLPEKSGEEECYAQAYSFGNYCRADRVLGLGAARCGPGWPHRHSRRLTSEKRCRRRSGHGSAAVAAREIPLMSSRFGLAARSPRFPIPS
jgi:hypothetical protein